jgi:apolipoprotein N-acyltransferase
LCSTVILADRLECIETNIKAESTIFFFAYFFSWPVGDALIIIIIIIIRKRRRKRRKTT